jgi:L-threonylcarbamoyladenylate synthase
MDGSVPQSVIEEEAQKALNHLQSGGVLVYPTDTVWGIGCLPGFEAAVERITALKERLNKQGFIVLMRDREVLREFVDVPEQAEHLMDEAQEPITIIYPGTKEPLPGIAGEDGSLAVRIPIHPFCQAVLKRLDVPLVSTSANMSGGAPPMLRNEIDPRVALAADYVVNLPASGGGMASSIYKITEGGSFERIR